MWGATISLLIIVAGVLYLEGPIASLAVAALGSAALLAALRYLQMQATACAASRLLEVVDGGASRNRDFQPLHKKAS